VTQSANTKGVKSVSQELYDHTIEVFTRQRSNLNLILGRRGVGKTNLSLLLHEILNEHNPRILHATNIKVLNPAFPIEYINNLESLRAWSATYKSTPKLFSLDEAAIVLKRRRFMASINVKIIEDYQVMRKYNLNLVNITQNETTIDSAVIDNMFLDGFYDRYSVNTLEYTDIFQRHKLDGVFDDIPETSLSYDTNDPAVFTEYPQEADYESRRAFFKGDEELVRRWIAKEPLNVSERSQLRRIKERLLKDKWNEFESANVHYRSREESQNDHSTP